MVPGVGIQRRQPLEAAIKLRVGFQQQLLRNGVINVAGIRHVSRVENRAGRTPWARQRRGRGEEALERIGDIGVEIIRYSGTAGIVGRIQLCHQLIANRRGQEVAVTGGDASGAGPGQMRAAVRRVVHADHDLSREHVLNPEVPLIDLGIARRPSVQIAGITKSPLCHLAVGGPLRSRQTTRKWAGASGLYRGRPETRDLLCEIVFVEMHNRRFREGRTGILEISGHVHAVKDSGATTQHGIGSELIGEAQTRSKIVSIHRRVAMAGAGKDARPSNLADLPKVKRRVAGVLVAAQRNVDTRVSSEIVELQPVVALRVGSAPLIAQADIDRQLWHNLPIVLHVEGGLFRFVRYRGDQVQRSLVWVTGQDGGKRVSLILVPQPRIGLRGGYVPREVEDAGGIVGLPEVVKEDALFAADFNRMSSFYPLQTRGVTEKRVGEVGVHAALGKQREKWVIDADSGHAGEPVGRKNRRQANRVKRWIHVTDAGGMHAVHTEAAGQQLRRSYCPVVLHAAILGIRQVNHSIALIAADDGGCGEFVVVTAVTSADFVIGRDLMIQLDVDLPTRIGAKDDLAPVGVRKDRTLYVGKRIQIQNRLADRVNFVRRDDVVHPTNRESVPWTRRG